VAVVGPGGAGKSTFTVELGRRTGLPVVHLDEHFWKPGWVETPKDEWQRAQAALAADDRWIIDGNYGGTFDVRFERADTVIVLAPPRLVCITGALTRSVRNRGRAVQAPGCHERVDLAFLRWIWRYPADSRPRLDAALGRHREQLSVIELRSRREAGRFLDEVGSRR
jgi:adenylate kinase family enzyme